MKRIFAVAVLASTFCIASSAAPLSAEARARWTGSGGWGEGTPYNRLYDVKTVETISGEVASADRIKPMRGMSWGVHLKLKTEKETIPVHLGPAWFVENQDIKIEPKDTVEVKGSRVTVDGKPAMIASEVKKGGQTLVLRDENGTPAWAGWKKR